MATIVEDTVILENVTVSFSTSKDEDGNDIETVEVVARGYSGDSTPPPIVKVRPGVVTLNPPTAWKNRLKTLATEALSNYFDIS